MFGSANTEQCFACGDASYLADILALELLSVCDLCNENYSAGR